VDRHVGYAGEQDLPLPPLTGNGRLLACPPRLNLLSGQGYEV
jgi:hypothetical protein